MGVVKREFGYSHPSLKVCTEPIERRSVNAQKWAEMLRIRGAKAAEEAVVMSEWVYALAPWQVILHFTFRWEASIWSAQRCFESFMRRHYGKVSYFYAIEQNPSRDGYHVHALWADAVAVYRREAWHKWFTRYGRARVEPVRSKDDVSTYCAKYVTKERSWWNVRLQWHRVQAINRREYALEN